MYGAATRARRRARTHGFHSCEDGKSTWRVFFARFGLRGPARRIFRSSPRAARKQPASRPLSFPRPRKRSPQEARKEPDFSTKPFCSFFFCRVFFARKRPAAQPANFHVFKDLQTSRAFFSGLQIKANALYFVDPLPHHSPFVVCGRYVRGFIGLPFCRPRVAQCRFRGFTRSHISKCHVCWDRVQFCHESIANVDGGMGVGRTSWHSNTYGIFCIPVAIP